MGRDIHYSRTRGTPLSAEEIVMVEAARSSDHEWDEDNPEITCENTPGLYNAMMQAVAERNQRVSRVLLKLA